MIIHKHHDDDHRDNYDRPDQNRDRPRHAEDDHADPHTQDPARRWSCEQLLMHQFFKSFSFKLPDSEEEV